MNTTQTTAADAFTAMIARIVKTTGCTVEQALDAAFDRMATENPALLGKIARGVAA